MSDLSKRLANLSPEKLQLLLKQKKSQKDTSQLGAVSRNRATNKFPLSFAQQRLWFLQQLEPESVAYHIPNAFRVQGTLSIQDLEQSLNQVIARHESLRTTFQQEDGSPLQVLAPHLTLSIPLIDLSVLPSPIQERERVLLARQEARRSFSLSTGPLLRCCLFRLAAQEHVLLFTIHHIVADGWSFSILIREMKAFYHAAQHPGSPVPLPALPIQYVDYTLWQRQWLQGERLQSQLDYWKHQLQGAPELLHLPLDRSRPAVQSTTGALSTQRLPAALWLQVQELSQREGVTVFMLLLAAFQILLLRYSGERDLVVGTPIAHRTQRESEDLIGFFVNTLPLRTDLSGNPRVREVLARVREVTLQAYAHQDVPFERLVEELQQERSSRYAPLVQVLFVLQNAPTTSMHWPGITWQPLEVERGSTQFDLTLQVAESEQGVLVSMEYSTELFETSTIERMLTHWQVLLEAIVHDATVPIEQLPILTAPESEQLLRGWQDTPHDYPHDVCLHQLFEQQAERQPEAVALVFEDQQLTYRMVNERANQLAYTLQQEGIEPCSLVGVCMERSPETVIALLGILKAGGAYVPIEPTYPEERMAFILQDSQMPLLLTQQSLLEKVSGRQGIRTLCLDTTWEEGKVTEQHYALRAVDTSYPAYVIYTSGSTGQPKGVLVTHANVARLFAATDHWYHFNEHDTWTCFHSFAFDFSVWELFGALLYGGRLVIVSYWESRSPAVFYETLRTKGVTVLSQTPSAFYQLLQAEAESAHTPTDLDLRFVIFGGEALDIQKVLPWWQQHGDKVPQLVNMYGITETTVHVTYLPLSESHLNEAAMSPIGCPIADLQVYLLDRFGQPVPIGVPGEMYVGGAGLANGYLNRSALTVERFVPDPFGGRPGARLYRTGDQARYRADGALEFIGRLDRQVKIRGFRIELGEIEAVLQMREEIREVVVMAREDVGAEKCLVAYVRGTGEEALQEPKLREYVRERLPAYMVPTYFVALSTFPLTAHGKVDLKALPLPQTQHRAIEQQHIPVQSPLEEIIQNVYRDILGIEQVGLHESFFDLGGHSLLATQVISRLRALTQMEIPLRWLFEIPSIAGLARHIEQSQARERIKALPPLVPVSREQELSLSFAQERLWFVQQLEPTNTAYHMPATFRLTGQLSIEVFDRCLQAMIQRHENLRTTFEMHMEQPILFIHPQLAVHLPLINLEGLQEPQKSLLSRQCIQEALEQPFDLSRGPLVRMGLLHLERDEYIFFVVVHHILFDAWATSIFLRELPILYQAFLEGKPSPLAPLALHYTDFASWQRQHLAGETLDMLLDYWRTQLRGAKPVELLGDRPRAKAVSDRGALFSFTIQAQSLHELKTLSRREGVTVFMTLLTAFQILLYSYTQQKDLVVGTDIANRTVVETEDMLGFFVNLLVLRHQLNPRTTFSKTVKSVCRMVLDAYAHQNLPFEKLVDALQLAREPGRVPLVNVLFVLQNVPQQAFQMPGLTVSPIETETSSAKFDLAMFLTEEEQGLTGSVNYRTDLFDTAWIERFARQFETLLQNIVLYPEQPIETLEMVDREEKERQLQKEKSHEEAQRRKLKVARRHVVLSPDED